MVRIAYFSFSFFKQVFPLEVGAILHSLLILGEGVWGSQNGAIGGKI